jgi:WD40 repeat protein
MSVVAPPRPPDLEPPPELDPLEALIEEARQRALRRRRRRAVVVVLATVALAAALLLVGRVLGDASDAATSSSSASGASERRTERNGTLAIMDVEVNAKGRAPVGWYGLSAVEPDGHLRPLVRCPGGADWCGWVLSLDWSPDGTKLALAVTSFGSANPANGIHVVDLATGRDRQLRTCRPPECGWLDLDWSPDGRTLAYVASGAIYLIRPGAAEAAAEPRRLVRGDRPSWSPDGRWIAFARTGPSGRSLHLIRPDGSNGHLLLRSGSAPAWSPDGRTIMYRRECRMMMTTPAGVDVTPPRLRRCIDFGASPVPFERRIGPAIWSPDGTKIAFSSSGRGTFVMNADGSGLVRVTKKSSGCACGQEPRPAWQPVPGSG